MFQIESYTESRIQPKIPVYLTENMQYYGLNPKSGKDRKTYANLLETMKVFEPRELRGTKKDSVTGFYWSRKEEFIAKYKYNIPLSILSLVLSVSPVEICKCIVSFINSNYTLSIYLIKLNAYFNIICVSVLSKENKKRKILNAIPLDKIKFYHYKLNESFKKIILY